MATFKIVEKFRIPYGVRILLTHAEACAIIGKPITAIVAILGMAGKPWAHAVATIIR